INWPTGHMPLAVWGANGPKAVIPTALKILKPADFFAKTWQSSRTSPAGLPRFIGMLSYDEFCPSAEEKITSIVYEVHACLIWDGANSNPKLVVVGQPDECSLRLDEKQIKELLKAAAETESKKIKGNALYPTMSDDFYISMVHEVLGAIRAGRYYQLNLLRWFRLAKPWTWETACQRMLQHGGIYSTLFRHGNSVVASFSPERFVSIDSRDGSAQIQTWPIKGTANRDLNDVDKDAALRDELAKSQKDLAELHMIVDLMRNDLAKICAPASVSVVDPGSVKTFAHVHHLQAEIIGNLNINLTIGEILSALCPAGSITGAPKREVMNHIRSLEGRDRGWFMGNAFLMDTVGNFDSSILIRTMTSNDSCRSWEYAAGSGIVIKSETLQELAEISSKCRPITD
ncbi:MAG: chorismate-binding protein, partial [Proteobacteria bacterium]|nr:chorismate-binding protein [Pseudomonadota bacterium]